MPAGLEILNTSYITQISSETINYHLYTKFWYEASGIDISPPSINTWFNPGNVMVASTSYFGVSRLSAKATQNQNGTWSINISGFRATPGNGNFPNEGFWIYVFVSKVPVSDHATTIEIYNADSTVAYSGTYKPMRLISIQDAPAAWNWSPEAGNIGNWVSSVNYGVSNIAVIHTATTDRYRETTKNNPDTDGTQSVTGWYRYGYAVRVVNNNQCVIQINRMIQFNESYSTGNPSNVLILDVSGY